MMGVMRGGNILHGEGGKERDGTDDNSKHVLARVVLLLPQPLELSCAV